MKKASTHRVGLIFCMLSLLAAGVPTAAFAQGPARDDAKSAVSQEDAEKAKMHFAKGAKYYYKEQYAQAIVEFLNAYKYKPDPMILYNLSMAHSRLGNIEEAHKAAARARQMGGMPDPAATKNAARLRGWGQVFAARTVTTRVAREAAQKREAAQTPEVAPPRVDIPAESDSTLSAAGWSGVGVSVIGLGLLGYAAYVDVAMEEDINAYESAARSNPAAFQSLKSDLDQRQTVGRIALYSGAACALIGLGLVTFDLLGEGAETTSVGLGGAGDGASVQVSYSFR
jgi:tetratricopeptide (TPR) repeat protein